MLDNSIIKTSDKFINRRYREFIDDCSKEVRRIREKMYATLSRNSHKPFILFPFKLKHLYPLQYSDTLYFLVKIILRLGELIQGDERDS